MHLRKSLARHAATIAAARVRFRKFVVGMWILSVTGAIAGIPFAGTQLVSQFDRSSVVAAPVGGIETSESAASALRFRTAVFHSRPTPTPTPTPEPEPEPEVETAVAAPAPAPPAPAGSITEIIYAAADEFGLDRGYLLSVAECESGLNPNAVNPAGYYGLFQFSQSTWAANGYGDILDPVAQSRTAARMISQGGAGHWPNCA